MPDFVYDIPMRQLAIVFSLIAVGAVIFGMLIIKPILRLLIGSPPDLNELITYGTASFSLFYGLLLGLLTVSAYQNNAQIKQAILNEATTLGALYADMASYPEPTRSDVKAMLRDYLLFTVYRDWPAHRQGEFLNGGANRTNAMRQALASFEPQTKGQEIIHAETIAAFQSFAEARQQRLTGVITQNPERPLVCRSGRGGDQPDPARHAPDALLPATGAGHHHSVLSRGDPLRDRGARRPAQGESGLDPEPLQVLWDRTMVWDEPLS